MEKHRYEMSRKASGGPWTIVVLDEGGHEVWSDSGYLTRRGARRAARKTLRAKASGNTAAVQTVTGTL